MRDNLKTDDKPDTFDENQLQTRLECPPNEFNKLSLKVNERFYFLRSYRVFFTFLLCYFMLVGIMNQDFKVSIHRTTTYKTQLTIRLGIDLHLLGKFPAHFT